MGGQDFEALGRNRPAHKSGLKILSEFAQRAWTGPPAACCLSLVTPRLSGFHFEKVDAVIATTRGGRTVPSP